jgi:hypothetical protein
MAARAHIARPRCQYPSVPSAGRLPLYTTLGGGTDLGALQSLPVGYDGKVPKGRDVSPGEFAIQYDLAAHR